MTSSFHPRRNFSRLYRLALINLENIISGWNPDSQCPKTFVRNRRQETDLTLVYFFPICDLKMHECNILV